jgi:sensor c-di-GMP phosphodiesterase-like protein
MKRIFQRRMTETLVATLLVASVCSGAGYLLGRVEVIEQSQQLLVMDAKLSGAPFAALLDEASAVLPVVSSSQYSFCSDAEIAYFRQLLFHMENLRDVGRIRDGRMVCSALFGRNNLPATVLYPTLTRKDGLKFYRNPKPYLSSKWMVFLLQQGDSYVVEDPSLKEHWRRVDVHFESTLIDAVSGQRRRPSGGGPLYPDAVLDRDWQGRIGDMLYATECTPHSMMCTTAYESLSATLWKNRRQLALYTALSGLAGAFLTLACLFILERNRGMSQQLRRAIRRDQVRIVYQPIVELATGKIVEAEALARWTDEEGFAVSPEVFVRIAEERGFVGELTALVVRHVLRDFGETLRYRQDLCININVTASDLEDVRFLPMLDNELSKAGVAPERLVVEVTESSTARHAAAIEAIRQLRARGHSVQIDDFGTGYSSLAYLHDLSVDAIKIDKTFIRAIGTEAVMVGILPQILAMAESLNLMVIAEGIETVEQASYFAGQQRPVLGQGWLFGRPGSAADLQALLAAGEVCTEAASRVV